MIAGLTSPALLACLGGGYLLGSIPFGVLLTRAAGVGDIRAIGSGNIGATNVLRTGRRDLALATLVGDAVKGAVAVLVARAFMGDVAGDIAGAAAFLGHIFPMWLRFRGGKGVATFFGVLFAIAWPAGLVAGAVWLLTAALLRYSSLAALFASAVAPGLILVLHRPRGAMWAASMMAALIFVRHRANIMRLRAGTEPRIGARGASPT